MIDTMYTAPYSWTDRQYFKHGTENIDNQLFGDFGINFAKKNQTELCTYSF